MVSSTGNWQAREVPPGTRVTLSRAAAEANAGRRIELFGDMGSVHFQQLVRGCGATEPGHFVANAGDSELAPIATLPGMRWNDSAVLLTGVVETTGGTSRTSP
jgi:hypothetical protein